MTKILGSLVGALVAKAGFPGVNNFNKDGLDHVLVRDVAAFTAANVVGDTVSLGFFKSTALLSPTAQLWFDAFGAGVTLNVGDVTYPSGLGAGISIAAAGNAPMMKAFTAAKMSQPLWQLLGYAADPKGTIELLGTIAGANVANAANIAWQIVGMNR